MELRKQVNEQFTAYFLPGEQDVVPLPLPHMPKAESANEGENEDGLPSVINGAIDRTLKVAHAWGDARADGTLSETGIAFKVNAAVVPGHRELDRAQEALSEHAAALSSEESALYDVPAISPSDAAGAIVDMEIRTWERSLNDQARAKLIDGLVRGDSPRVMEALLRSPVPSAFRNILEDAHRARVKAANPEKARNLEQRRATIAWGANVLRALPTYLDHAANFSSKTIAASKKAYDASRAQSH